jgi:sugar lactone lactonase YvrE
MSTKLTRTILVVTLLAGWAPWVEAYDLIRRESALVKWAPGTVNLRIMLGTTPTLQDGTNYSTTTLAAIDEWNTHLQSIKFAGTVVEAGTGSERNGVNELFFAPNVYGDEFGERTIAVTVFFSATTPSADGTFRRTEADVVFNNTRTWNSYRGVRQGAIDMRRVALHELGHVLGLDHPDENNQEVAAIMNSLVGDIDRLQEDDIQGAQFIYGVPPGTSPPANNNFANAIPITLSGNTARVTGTSVLATKEPGEPNHAPNEAGGASVWWRWTAPTSGSLKVDTDGSNFDTMLGAYTGSAVGSLTQIGANDDVDPGVIRTSILTFDVTGGTTYHLAVDGWEGEWGNVVLNLSFTTAATPPAPLIEAQTVTAGQGVSFSASPVSGATFQWQASPDGNTWSNLANDARYSGVTTATLTLTGADAALSGTRFRYIVTTPQASATSSAAVLTVAPNLLPFPVAVATDGTGVLYVADTATDLIRRVTIGGTVTTLAGQSGTAGSADGAGITATFNDPGGLAATAANVITVADTANALIRRISDLGVVSTLAGSPTARGNADGTGAAATFQSPRGLALDGAGNAYVADTQNHTIRRITSAGVVTTLAGAAGSPGSGDGSGSTARFNQPRGVAVAPGGDLYVADTGNNLIRRVTSAGVVTTVAGIFGISGSGDGAAAAASFNQPTGLATDESGNLYIADTGNSAIRRLAPDGQVTTLAGLPTVAGLKDGSGQEAWFNQPRDLIVLGQYLYVLDTGNAVLRRVTLSNQTVMTMTLAAGTGPGANPGFAPAPLPSNPSTPPPSSGGGGGGGAPSVWFMAALALMMFARRLQARA